MRRLLLTICYDGTEYCGWQMQKNALSVQQKITEVLETVVGKLPNQIVGCSRTDSGVHANKYYCHFNTESDINVKNIVLALNSRLPKDISVINCKETDDTFHARYSAKKKRYIYKFYCSEVRNPFIDKYCYKLNEKPNIDLLNKYCELFLGTHNFKSFCASGSTISSTVREIYSCSFVENNNLIEFTIEGNGFLYNMVRIIVGTILELYKKNKPYEEVTNIINSCDRSKAGKTAPAHALYLDEVFY